MSYLLSIEKLTIEGWCGEAWSTLVDHIDLHLDHGEVLGLIGESGAGKSTLGLACLGYTRPGCRIAGGSIVFDGMELTTASEEKLRKLRGNRIAYVAQSAAASFNPAHRIVYQFTEGPVHHRLMNVEQSKEKAIALYQRLSLPDPARIGYRYPHQLSGGQLQRAMVAMAMSSDPEIVVFDEPTTALDVTTQIEVMAAIKETIRDRNTAAIYITHDLAVVSQLADRIMVMREGRLVEEAATRKLLSDPKEKYTHDLLHVRSWCKEEASSSEEVVLEVSGVSAGYIPRCNVVENVSFRVRRGRTVAVVGESGSGKTSLARVIMGLLPPDEGNIVFNGKLLPPSLKHRDRDSLRRMQMIYQMPDVSLNPRQKVRKILGRPLYFHFGMSAWDIEKRIFDLLEMVELPRKYTGRYPSELSGGEKQRICIARALAAKPDLIICDEVTSALDNLVAEGILKLMLDLQNEMKVCYLYITHDLATVKAISDEIIVMLKGRIVEKGIKKKILTPPHHEYTELLLSSVPEMNPDWLNSVLAGRACKEG